MSLQWVCVSEPEMNRKAAKWKRCAALDDDGTVFVPAVIGGNEMAAFLAASWNRTPAVLKWEHIYLPAQWVAAEYPKAAQLCARIEQRVREFLAEDT
jgi:hypothetical protein